MRRVADPDRESPLASIYTGHFGRLALNGGNLRLESSTTFNLSVSSAANAGNPYPPGAS